MKDRLNFKTEALTNFKQVLLFDVGGKLKGMLLEGNRVKCCYMCQLAVGVQQKRLD